MINSKFTCPGAFGFNLRTHIYKQHESISQVVQNEKRNSSSSKNSENSYLYHVLLILSTNLVLNTFLMQIDGFFYQSKYLCFILDLRIFGLSVSAGHRQMKKRKKSNQILIISILCCVLTVGGHGINTSIK